MFFVVNTRRSAQNFAYVMGGFKSSSTYFSSTDKFNYLTNATTSGTSLSAKVDGGSQGAGGLKFGIVLGYFGVAPTHESQEKYTYSGDVVSASGAAAESKYYQGCFSRSNVGVFAGGKNTSDVAQSTVQHYDFHTDTCALQNSMSSTVTDWGQGAGNSSEGRIYGGLVSGSRSTTNQKYTYSGDVWSTFSTGYAADNVGACGNKTSGFVTGGQTGGVFGAETELYKAPYSTDTLSLLGQLVGEVGELGLLVHASQASPEKGYTFGGQLTSAGGSQTSGIYSWQFSDDTILGLVGNLSIERAGPSATSGNPGWF